ncbi:MAG: ABC transporter permease [Anaerovoracaceae bacterium]|nr:FtsX-like permease family protein [Clostridiales bacterium]
MLLFENIKLAITAIKANSLRSFLTMLGIIIGISSVISISSIGASAKGVVSDEFESIGEAYMFIMVNYSEMMEVYMDYSVGFSDLFTVDDVEALKKRFPEDVKYAVPYTFNQGRSRIGRNEIDISLIGIDQGYDQFNKTIEIVYGSMISEQDVRGKKDRIVIDTKCALKLYGRENVVGEIMPLNMSGGERDFIITGVYYMKDTLASKMSAAMGMSTYTGYAPYTSLLTGDGYSSYIEVYGNPNKDVKQQGDDISRYMERVKDKTPGFYMTETAEGQQKAVNQVLGVLSIAIGTIAAISLVVGGIGIMNIMLVSVTERTREIGIRKALGARTKDILTQFLIEAVILSIMGGIIGTVLGIVIATVGMKIAGVSVVIQPLVVLMAVVFSGAVGLFFGIFPARRAAKLDPIEALRYE